MISRRSLILATALYAPFISKAKALRPFHARGGGGTTGGGGASNIVRKGSADLGYNSSGGPGISTSYTVNASSTLLVVAVNGGGGGSVNDITGATFNSVSMTLAGSLVGAASGLHCISLFYLFNPATGSHTVSVTHTGALDLYVAAVAADYSGVNTTGLDSTVQTYTNNSLVTSIQGDVVINTGGSWIISMIGGGTYSSLNNINLTQVISGAGGGGITNSPVIFDSNAGIPTTGNYASTYNFSSTRASVVSAAFKSI